MACTIESTREIGVDKFNEFGFCTLRQAITSSVLAFSQTSSTELINRRKVLGLRSEDRSDGWQFGPAFDGEPVLFRLNGPWLKHHLAFAALLMANPNVEEALTRLMAGDDFAPVADALVFKDVGKGFGHRWHQDPADVLVPPSVMVGFHLDSSDASNGALRVVPGSHSSVSGVDWSRLAESEWYTDRPGTRVLQAEAGDVTIHSTQLVHGSLPTSGSRMRRIYYVQFERRANAERLAPDSWTRLSYLRGVDELLNARELSNTISFEGA